MEWEIQLITLYCDVYEQYQTHLWRHCERMSNNASPEFTDEEVITISLFGIQRKHRTVKQSDEYMRDHLAAWFPLLPSYEGYVQRLNTLSSVFLPLLNAIAPTWQGGEEGGLTFVLDSMPIVLAQGRRRYQAKIAREVSDCGYCASKDLHYYGLKLHLFGIKRPGTLPHPEYLELTSARPHDVTVLHAIVSKIWHGELFADNAYVSELLAFLLTQQQVVVYTPPKKAKGQESLSMFDRLLSPSICWVRQPIESFFSWLEEKTGIQMASKVRSLKGLLVPVYGRLTAAMYLLKWKSVGLCPS